MIAEVKEIPAKAKRLKRDDKGRLVLALGEATGHMHAIASREVSFWEMPGSERYLKVRKRAYVDHEEHDRIELPPGNYKVKIQKQYTPAGIVNVAD
jgi:hypothetical protein